MNLGKLRLGILLAQSVWWRNWARLRGAEVADDVLILGQPQVRVARGGRLMLGPGVKIISTRIVNPLIGRNGSSLWVMEPGAVLEMGPHSGGSGVCLCAAREIRIGEGTILGADCMILDNNFHVPLPEWKWGDDALGTAQPVRIGRGCFLGARSIVLKGVTIGDGAVVGAGSVVVHDVPPGHLAAGNPALVRPLPAKWRRNEGVGGQVDPQTQVRA